MNCPVCENQPLNAVDDAIHKIFARPWQRKIAQVDYESRIRQTLGEDKYQDVKTLKSWLDGDPNRGVILAYLERRAGD